MAVVGGALLEEAVDRTLSMDTDLKICSKRFGHGRKIDRLIIVFHRWMRHLSCHVILKNIQSGESSKVSPF
jgi:hypothetical protein